MKLSNVDAEVARLADLVVHGPVDPSGCGGRVVCLRDPERNLLETFQVLEEQ